VRFTARVVSEIAHSFDQNSNGELWSSTVVQAAECAISDRSVFCAAASTGRIELTGRTKHCGSFASTQLTARSLWQVKTILETIL
jgi:hypothetical protein